MIGLAFVSYTIGTWGYVLVKGYNISLVEWVTPLHPFNGPLAAAGDVPVGHVFPPGGASNATNTGKGSKKTGPTGTQ